MLKIKSTFFYLIIFLLGLQIAVRAQDNLSALLPYPNKVTIKSSKANFTITHNTYIAISADSLLFEAQYLQKIIQNRMGITLPIHTEVSPKSNSICLTINNENTNLEHYTLKVTAKTIVLSSAAKGGIFYGINTLDQILLGDIVHTKQKEITPISIDDQPRIARRMLMLDPARHFLPVDAVKKYIDVMAKYKYNVLQLHLTDDQGWRIEIKKYPKLTSAGAFRNAKTGANGPDNGFYTQDQLKNLVKYAADRNIEIVPELDIPGHTAAILTAYPNLGCTNTTSLPKELGKTDNLMLCAANDQVYTMYQDILKEVAHIFPSKYIHLGGDESAIKNNWAKCEKCQALKEKLHYKGDTSLMNYFFDKMLRFVKSDGKKPILWCELDNIRQPASKFLFAYPKDATLVSWRYGLTPKCMSLTYQSGNPLILAPGEFAYFDYPQYRNDLPEYHNWGMPTTTLKKVYSFDPGYGFPKVQQAHITGICATLWGEAIIDINRAFYMTYPRGLAFAEAGWTEMKNRSWQSFKNRLYPNLDNLAKEGISYRVPFEIAN